MLGGLSVGTETVAPGARNSSAAPEESLNFLSLNFLFMQQGLNIANFKIRKKINTRASPFALLTNDSWISKSIPIFKYDLVFS